MGTPAAPRAPPREAWAVPTWVPAKGDGAHESTTGGILSSVGDGPQATRPFTSGSLTAPRPRPGAPADIWATRRPRPHRHPGYPRPPRRSMPPSWPGPACWRSAACTVLAIPCNTSHYFADRHPGPAPHPHHPHDSGDGPPSRPWGRRPWASLPPTAPSAPGSTKRTHRRRPGPRPSLPEKLQKTVMSIIYEEIKRGETGQPGEIRPRTPGSASGCDCAILGCTELSVFRSSTACPPYVGRHGGAGRAGRRPLRQTAAHHLRKQRGVPTSRRWNVQ